MKSMRCFDMRSKARLIFSVFSVGIKTSAGDEFSHFKIK